MPQTPQTPPTSAATALNWLQTSAPPPKTRSEALSLAIHALLLTHGFRPATTPPTTTPSLPTSLPPTWSKPPHLGQYRHNRSAMTFEILATPLASHLLVAAAALDDDHTLHQLQLRLADHLDPSQTFPIQTSPPWSTLLLRINDLATLVQVQIAHKLVPDAAKEGYEPAPPPTNIHPAAGPSIPPSYHPPPFQNPYPYPPLRDEDPLRIGQPNRPIFPAAPLGADDLLAPGLPRGLGGGQGPSGMRGNLLGPNNFPGRGAGPPRPPGVPPGARFDPYGPGFGNDIERMPGFEDEHGLGGPGAGDSGGALPPGRMFW